MPEPASPEKLVVEVSLGDLTLVGMGEHAVTFADRIAALAVEKLVEGAAKEPWHDDLKRRVEAIRDEQIKATLEPLIREGLESVLQRTDGFGHPKGEPTTLRAMILAQVASELTVHDRGGRARGTGPAMSTLELVVHEEVQRVLRTEMLQAVKTAREQVMAAIEAEAAGVIRETIARVTRA